MTVKTVDYFDHIADIGIIGRGSTLEAAFEAAAQAMFGIMVNQLNTILPKIPIEINFEENDVEFAFVTWLNLLLAIAKDKDLVLSQFKLQRENSHWHGQAWGEVWRADISRGTEVKGPTLTMLSVKKVNDLWEARCVLDV